MQLPLTVFLEAKELEGRIQAELVNNVKSPEVQAAIQAEVKKIVAAFMKDIIKLD